MPTNGMTALRQVEMIKQKIRGLPGRLHAEAPLGAHPVLADVVHLRRHTLPTLPGEPRICRLDDKCRIRLTDVLCGLGWESSELSATYAGQWVTLAPSGPLSTHRQVARHTKGRITLPAAVRRHLEIARGDTVLALVVPDAKAVALINPAVLLVAAPFGLLGVPSGPVPGGLDSTQPERSSDIRFSPTPTNQEVPQ
jgi:AbrB family looped-hinge helix DNA binding protein